jgi:hypothetical protein
LHDLEDARARDVEKIEDLEKLLAARTVEVKKEMARANKWESEATQAQYKDNLLTAFKV